jgi:hypothetical protein
VFLRVDESLMLWGLPAGWLLGNTWRLVCGARGSAAAAADGDTAAAAAINFEAMETFLDNVLIVLKRGTIERTWASAVALHFGAQMS